MLSAVVPLCCRNIANFTKWRAVTCVVSRSVPTSAWRKKFSPRSELLVQSACETPSIAVVCYVPGWGSPGPSIPSQADGDFSARHLHLDTTLPSSETCARSSGFCSPSRCFPVMPSGCNASEVSNCSSFRPSACAPRDALLVWSSPNDSGSVHGIGDCEHDEISGCCG